MPRRRQQSPKNAHSNHNFYIPLFITSPYSIIPGLCDTPAKGDVALHSRSIRGLTVRYSIIHWMVLPASVLPYELSSHAWKCDPACRWSAELIRGPGGDWVRAICCMTMSTLTRHLDGEAFLTYNWQNHRIDSQKSPPVLLTNPHTHTQNKNHLYPPNSMRKDET